MRQHLFLTQDYAPDLGGMARRHVELCRRFPHGSVLVSTVAAPEAAPFDAQEPYAIARERFPFAQAKVFTNQVRWAAHLVRLLDRGVGVVHLGNIRPCGYAVMMARRMRNFPYVVYVNGGDLLREERKVGEQGIKRWSARDILGHARGIVANSAWTADLARRVMRSSGVRGLPEVAAIDLGTDPVHFHPARDQGTLRRQLGIGGAPLLVTIARLVPHKGQDTVIDALPHLDPDVHYLVVGGGEYRAAFEARAVARGVAGRVHFLGAVSDDLVAEAYATASVYVGMSRLDHGINVEGFGISFVEASASGVPVVAGDSGGVRSAVRDGETGLVIAPDDATLLAATIRGLLSNDARRRAMGAAGRQAAEAHYNWDRVARETLAFVERVTTEER
ncbi:MAG: glycosyltransferase family 4 protein [Gemmatimonadetes bacterium]|nr:glycosyltransferase family 4 protein [Gemmatimonadota bacterium]